MNDPVLYNKYCKLPRQDVKELLEKYRNKILWKSINDRCLDIGCADGGITSEILKPYLPSNYSKLVGSDINQQMVEYANKHHGDGRTNFVVHDIQSNIPENMRESFDHVFSFYTLHWAQRHRAAMINIYNILADEGDCLLMFIAFTPVFSVYRLLAKNPKWAPWLADAEKYISPYQDSLKPEREFRSVMEGVGFKNIDVACQHKSYTYKGKDCINYVKGITAAVNPFDIPKELMDEYLEDYVNTLATHKLAKYETDVNGELVGVRYEYSLLVAYGCK